MNWFRLVLILKTALAVFQVDKGSVCHTVVYSITGPTIYNIMIRVQT